MLQRDVPPLLCGGTISASLSGLSRCRCTRKMSVWCCNLIRQNPREEDEAKRSRTCPCLHACSTGLKQRGRTTNEFWQHGVPKTWRTSPDNVHVQMNTDQGAEVSCDAWICTPHPLGNMRLLHASTFWSRWWWRCGVLEVLSPLLTRVVDSVSFCRSLPEMFCVWFLYSRAPRTFSSLLDLLDYQILFYLHLNYVICSPGFNFSDFCHLSNAVFQPSSLELLTFACLWWPQPVPSAGVSEQMLRSIELSRKVRLSEIRRVRLSVSAAIKSKKWGNILLPSACLEERFTIATAQQVPHSWQVKTLYILTVKVAGTELICRRVAAVWQSFMTLYTSNEPDSPRQSEQSSSSGVAQGSWVDKLCRQWSTKTAKTTIMITILIIMLMPWAGPGSYGPSCWWPVAWIRRRREEQQIE